ncbi:Glycosyltransferase involved in cell wall bisynthesis [Geodermatophilus amargosae]|uniref:Glycosyltransferase involved in cell wall bisynthesis n=1 Tax=Geodermatophilus amargosae TaxID=1296565 RepID=A0A1I6X6Q4_9ACTN|nr:glycosyltransferase [Geodermatophilus amargosae]SFT33939.1 Glycosyltransferase involved in cell wall bisynthesis [Geodermatophilus amargosae]
MEIVSIATHVPYVGIPHAGGQYYGRHVELLSTRHRLTVVGPWTPANAAALDQPAAGTARRVVAGAPPSGRAGRRRALFARALPFLATGPFRRALVADEDLVATLRRADAIELQWFDAIVLAPWLRRLLPGTPMTGVFHDVVTQGHRRRLMACGAPLRHRALALVRLLCCAPLERRVLRVLDTAVVLSDKDRALLAARGRSPRLVVAAPPLDDAEVPRSLEHRAPSGPEVLFVGALWRAENEDAALWLLDEIWPAVRMRVPAARLTVAGADPTQRIRQAAEAQPGVELTGRVASLAPFYRRSTVAVVPVRLGAGVKLKTVVAMLWGVPVVATTVGSEGIDGPDVFLSVTDEATALADAVVAVLQNPHAAADVAARAHAWAHDRYSSTAYRRVLEDVYG